MPVRAARFRSAKPAASGPGAAPQPFRLTQVLTPEDSLHKQVVDALWRCLPQGVLIQTFELRNAASALEGARRKWRGAIAGFPDLGIFWRGRTVFLEIKRADGTLSEAQKVMHSWLKANGFPVYVCRGRAAAQQALDACAAHGIPVAGRVAA